jgi:hypothetical protein
MSINRRRFLQNAGQLAAGVGLASIPGGTIASGFVKDSTTKVPNETRYV